MKHRLLGEKPDVFAEAEYEDGPRDFHLYEHGGEVTMSIWQWYSDAGITRKSTVDHPDIDETMTREELIAEFEERTGKEVDL